MSVFLRWGVFGILGFAALLYAYNASKRLADNRTVAATAASQPLPGAEAANFTEVMPAHCQVELAVALRALEARRQAEPVDRLMRMHEITFEHSTQRRERLQAVALAWFGLQGDEPAASELRAAVLKDCAPISPEP